MANNRVPNGIGVRVRLANTEAAALLTYAVPIGITVVTQPVMQGKIDDFTGADSAVAILNTARSNAQSTVNIALASGVTLASVIKRYVTDLPGFGTDPNAQWQQLGFAAGSLEIPRATIELMLEKMATFLGANPDYESIPRGVTVADCTNQKQNIINVRAALGAAKAVYATQKGVEDAAFKALGKTMSDLVKELKLHLKDDDARWYAFGLRRPDDPETPAAPHNFHAQTAGVGLVFCDWDDVPGATRYQVYLAQGAQKAVRVASVEDSEHMLQDLIVNSTVTIYIVASNEGGESVPSESVTISVV